MIALWSTAACSARLGGVSRTGSLHRWLVARVEILARVGLEGFLTTGGTEVVGLALVFGRLAGRLWIDTHATDRVLLHGLSLSPRIRCGGRERSGCSPAATGGWVGLIRPTRPDTPPRPGSP